MKKLIVLSSLFLVSCSTIPQEAYFNRGEPESLLDMSAEVVNIALDDAAGTDELIGWINQEQPSRADLACADANPNCRRAEQVLDQFGVPFEMTEGRANTVALYYERVMTRDCENRYIDNSINPYNLNHPTFGCSVASNMVQQVTEKRQFVNPALVDYVDGEKTVQVYRGYEAKTPKESAASSSSLLKGTSVSR